MHFFFPNDSDTDLKQQTIFLLILRGSLMALALCKRHALRLSRLKGTVRLFSIICNSLLEANKSSEAFQKQHSIRIYGATVTQALPATKQLQCPTCPKLIPRQTAARRSTPRLG